MVGRRYQENGQETMKSLQVFTLEQIKCHDNSNDLWMVIYNKVYDVTSFIPSHPGSAEVLLDCGGVDATEAFEDVAHSDDAFQMLEPYFIGNLESADCKKYNTSRNPSSNIDFAKKNQKKDDSPRQQEYKLKLPDNFLEKLWIVLLIIIALFSIMLYLSLQKVKWNYTGQL
ncbi:unnamed protein product [Debaryomyces fabryi]|nr:unnamed protein product [Debaryomyces fabryi]